MQSTILALATFASMGASASIPIPWEVTGFTASKGHLSAMCRYSFNISSSATTEPVTCGGMFDSGSSGATWLASVYPFAGTCDNEEVSWAFSNPRNDGGDVAEPANLTISWVKEGGMAQTGSHIIPGEQIKISLNDEPNPYDNDVSYGGPKDFVITPTTPIGIR